LYNNINCFKTPLLIFRKSSYQVSGTTWRI